MLISILQNTLDTSYVIVKENAYGRDSYHIFSSVPPGWADDVLPRWTAADLDSRFIGDADHDAIFIATITTRYVNVFKFFDFDLCDIGTNLSNIIF